MLKKIYNTTIGKLCKFLWSLLQGRSLVSLIQVSADIPVIGFLLFCQVAGIYSLGSFAYMGWQQMRKAGDCYYKLHPSSHKPPSQLAQAPGGDNHPPTTAEPKDQNVGDAIHAAFQGLEFFLLAPLLFLLLRSLSQYIIDLTQRELAFEFRRNQDRSHSATEEDALGDFGKESLLEAKELSIGLLFAIVATHMVGKLVVGSYETQPMEKYWMGVIAGTSLLIILGATYIFMVKLTHLKKPKRHRSDSSATPRNPPASGATVPPE